MIEAIQGYVVYLAVAAGAGAAVWAVGKFIPGLVAKKLKVSFQKLHASGWLHDPAYPRRRVAYLAVLELLEEEIPDPGNGEEFYKAIGQAIHANLPLPIKGKPESWAKAVMAIGDTVDAALDDEIAGLKK